MRTFAYLEVGTEKNIHFLWEQPPLSELFHSHSFQRKIILFTYGRLVLNCKTETRKRFTKLSGKQPIGAVSLEPSSTKFYKLI